jgi:hypothetical protein
MDFFHKLGVWLPPALGLLVNARALAQHSSTDAVLRDAVMAFAHLDNDMRQTQLFDFHWSKLPSRDWVEFTIGRDTLEVARQARLGCWSRHQLILAAVSWWLVAL